MNRFRRHICLVSLALALLGSHADACLTFCLQHEKNLVYGRNFDWQVGVGAVMVNQRHVRKTAFVFPPNKPVSWISRYGSITFNQFSKEVPVGGMNEQGLVIECMVSAAEYPRLDKRNAINELQWIQYHLDTCKTADAVIKSAQRVRITPYAVKLHYFITDSSGRSAVIEYLDGKMSYRSGKALPTKVLANTRYDRALKTATSQDNRFARSARMIRQYDGRRGAVEYAFTVLEAVSQGKFTKWQIVYDIARRRISFRTLQSRKAKLISLSDFDFEHTTKTLMIDVNIDEEGPVLKQFKAYTEELNDKLMKASLRGFKRAGIMQHIKPEHIEAIRTAVTSCKREDTGNDNKAFERTRKDRAAELKR
jgi:penicillin V acylase-like amidase (Ntn superfamily)